MTEQRNCHICNRTIVAASAPWRSHLRKHVNEGILIEKKIEKGQPEFNPARFTWWGYVLTSDRNYVTIRSFTAPHSSITIERFKMAGITKPGDAVKLMFKSGDPSDPGRGLWMAEPLGYSSSAWIRMPAIYG